LETEATLTERLTTTILDDSIETEAHPTSDTTLDSEATTIQAMDHHRTMDHLPSPFPLLCPLLTSIILMDLIDLLILTKDMEVEAITDQDLALILDMDLDTIITDHLAMDQDSEDSLDLDTLDMDHHLMDILLMDQDLDHTTDQDSLHSDTLDTDHHTDILLMEPDMDTLLLSLLFPTLMDLDIKLPRSTEVTTTSDNPDMDLNHLDLDQEDSEDSEDLEDERSTDPRPISMSSETTTSSRWIFPDINAITSTSSLPEMSSTSSLSPLLELTTSTSTRDLLEEATSRESSTCLLTLPPPALLPY